MRVPSAVESGSQPHVILDCDYDLSESERSQVDVKWYFRDDPQPFFQWLPGRPPQAIGELFENGRLDLSYEVDTQPGEKKEFKKHRALKIMRPTTELTGTYRCKVSSFVDEDFMQKKMIIYSPVKDIDLIYTKPDDETINLTCSATGVFPEPNIDLHWGQTSPLDDRSITTTLTVERDGLYDITVHKLLKQEELSSETVFQCVLTIPDTSYTIKEETMYFPGKVMYQVKASNSSRTFSSHQVTLVAAWMVVFSIFKAFPLLIS